MVPAAARLPDSDVVWAGIRTCINKVIPALADLDMDRDTNFNNLGASSIEMITVIFEIEEMYDVVIVDAGLDVFETAGELRDLVMSLLPAESTP